MTVRIGPGAAHAAAITPERPEEALMTSPYITELLVQQHTEQLLHEAHQHRLARAAKPRRGYPPRRAGPCGSDSAREIRNGLDSTRARIRSGCAIDTMPSRRTALGK